MLELTERDELDYLEFKNELIELTIQLVQWKGLTAATTSTLTSTPTSTTMTSTLPAPPIDKRKTIALRSSRKPTTLSSTWNVPKDEMR